MVLLEASARRKARSFSFNLWNVEITLNASICGWYFLNFFLKVYLFIIYAHAIRKLQILLQMAEDHHVGAGN